MMCIDRQAGSRRVLRSLLLSAAFAAALGACGGGGSSGGAGGGTTPLASTYTGRMSMTLSGDDMPPFTASDPATLRISPEGTVVLTLTDGNGELYGNQGVLNGNRFAIVDEGEVSQDGVTCRGRVTISGAVSGHAVLGTLGGSVTCNGLPIEVTGNLEPEKTATAMVVQPEPSSAKGLHRVLERLLRPGRGITPR